MIDEVTFFFFFYCLCNVILLSCLSWQFHENTPHVFCCLCLTLFSKNRFHALKLRSNAHSFLGMVLDQSLLMPSKRSSRQSVFPSSLKSSSWGMYCNCLTEDAGLCSFSLSLSFCHSEIHHTISAPLESVIESVQKNGIALKGILSSPNISHTGELQTLNMKIR